LKITKKNIDFETIASGVHVGKVEVYYILMRILRKKSENVLTQFLTFPATYEATLKAFKNYISPKKNIIFERCKSHSKVQLPDES